jgi:hypothetical protein
VKVGEVLKQPGFDKVDRKHPVVRFLALDDVNVALGHKLVPETGDKVLGASDGGASPLLVAGMRGGYRFVAAGFDVRDSDLPLRTAWPLFIINCVNWFTDEDTQYLSSFRTGEVWRIPVAGGVTAASIKLPDGTVMPVPVHEGRAVLLGEQAGFYELTAGEQKTEFAANLLDASESTIARKDTLPVDGRVVEGQAAGGVASVPVGLPPDAWMWLLLAVAALTALEWATYHRRLTV